MSTNQHQDHQRPLSSNTTNASEVDPNDNLKTGKYLCLEAQLLSNLMDVTDSLTHIRDVSFISQSFVDRFGRTLQFCHLEFDKGAISNGCRSENPGIGGLL